MRPSPLSTTQKSIEANSTYPRLRLSILRPSRQASLRGILRAWIISLIVRLLSLPLLQRKHEFFDMIGAQFGKLHHGEGGTYVILNERDTISSVSTPYAKARARCGLEYRVRSPSPILKRNSGSLKNKNRFPYHSLYSYPIQVAFE